MVRLRIPKRSAMVHVEKADPQVYFRIYDLLTYRKDYGRWEKPESLYDPYERTFPVGLIPRVKKVLNADGYRVRVIDERQIESDRIKIQWNERYSLRRYQERAVRKAIKNKMGVLALPVGSGKTIVGLAILHRLSLPSLIVVHTKELLYQWADRVEEVLGVEPGLIGDGHWKEGDITVAMIQTLTRS